MEKNPNDVILKGKEKDKGERISLKKIYEKKRNDESFTWQFCRHLKKSTVNEINYFFIMIYLANKEEK